MYTGLGNWSEDGCKRAMMNNVTGEVKCSCTHLTNFAILVVSARVIDKFAVNIFTMGCVECECTCKP